MHGFVLCITRLDSQLQMHVLAEEVKSNQQDWSDRWRCAQTGSPHINTFPLLKQHSCFNRKLDRKFIQKAIREFRFFLCIVSPQQSDLRLSGPPSGQGSNPRQKDPCRY
ncbi:proline-rich protein 5 [Plakobranchus ocellatus]|uniref:Proline-rich protein 5 n=1 Tax=Plakobranchus ocellatus TaxID=259542 RepID=A0AAV4B2K9_9GAST|nr:proline-rich protein 5 [Plakobranchus ocellatus]